MKAIRYYSYGPPAVLKLEEIAAPTPGDTEVLIRVRAASVNPYDWHFMRGEPYPLRLMSGGREPKDSRLGADVAGQVEAVGKSVTGFKAGDNVFGTCKGAFAEYACASESSLTLKPKNVSFEQAASAGVAALTALQALRDKGHIQPGMKVLINGASGGVGTFAVQIAKSFSTDVTAVCSTRNVDMVRSIGADHVVDYTREDFSKSSGHYDIVLDLVGNHSLSACRRVLKPHGVCVGAGGTTDRWMIGPLVRMITEPVLSRFGSRKLVSVLAKINTHDLTMIGELIATGKVIPVVDRVYTLGEVPKAIEYLEEGHAKGKVVISLS